MDSRALKLLEEALTRAPDERETWIKRAAGDDRGLLGDALELLAAHQASSGLLEPSPHRSAPEQLGPWRVSSRLGAGGMGEVYLATRSDAGYQQQAALKLAAIGLAGPEALARLAAERQFLARIEHPNIARIIDGGSTADGRPYVVMEYVDGLPIDLYCAEHQLDLTARIKLFGQLIDAVDAAHRALVLHRDLKPSNVLVRADGLLKLLDFGIAKSLSAASELTATGIGPLTPLWASPEQLAGEPLTMASDVYGLGLLLHLLLTGKLPDAGQRPGLAGAARSTTAPTRPSAVIDRTALAIDAAELHAWKGKLEGDLDRVLLKALAVDVDRRYPTARALGDDLANWLALKPVSARSGERGYQWRLFVRRHRLAVGAAGGAVLALAIGLAVAADQALRARDAAQRAESASQFLLALITDANPAASGSDLSLRAAIEQAVTRIPEHFADQPAAEADVRMAIGTALVNLYDYAGAAPQLERALELRAPATVGYADALRALALLDWSLGRTDRAASRYREALSIYQRFNAPATGSTHNDLAALMSDLGQFDEAVAHARVAVDAARTQGLDAGALGSRLENLGSALQGSGALAEAEQTYLEAIRTLEQALPQRTAALATALNNFALVYRDQQRLPEALALFDRAVELRTKAFGSDDPDLCGPWINSARIRAQLGDTERAHRDAQAAVALALKAYAPDYVGLGHVHLGAGEVALAAGAAPMAADHAKAALDVFARADSADPSWSERAKTLLSQAEPAGG